MVIVSCLRRRGWSCHRRRRSPRRGAATAPGGGGAPPSASGSRSSATCFMVGLHVCMKSVPEARGGPRPRAQPRTRRGEAGMGERRSAQFLYLLCWGDCLICRQSGCTKMLNMSSSMQQLVNHVTQQALPASVSPCCSEPIEAWRRSRAAAAAAAASEDWAPMLAWGSGAKSTHSQHTANTQTTHNQHTTNTQPTHKQHTATNKNS